MHDLTPPPDALALGVDSSSTLMPPAHAVQLRRIQIYYDETWRDYRRFWLNPHNYAIHFGYWDEHTRSHPEALLNLNLVLAARIGIHAGQRILDAGCGVGGSSIWLARTFDVEVVGITPVASQIERARRFAVEAGVAGQVRFEQNDYTATGYPEHSFDVVWAMESVCHAPEKRLFLAEAHRLLNPDGRLGLVEYMRHRRPESPAGEALLQSWLSGWAIPDLASRDEFSGWAAACGFVNLDVSDITPNVERSLHRLYRIASVTWPLAKLGRRVGLRTATQHGNTRGARDQYRALRRGLWFSALLTASAG